MTSENNDSSVTTVSQQVAPDERLGSLNILILSSQEILLQSKLYQAASANVGYQNPVFDLEQGVQGLQGELEGEEVDHQMGKSRRSHWALRGTNSARLESGGRVCPAPSQPR